MIRFSFHQKILVGFILTIIAVLIGVYIAYSRIGDFQKDGAAVDHTQEILKFTNQAVFNVVEAESNIRGYIATGKKSYLDKYNNALSKINPSVDRVVFLLNEDRRDEATADSLKANVDEKLFALSRVLWVANLDGTEKAKELLAEDTTLDRLESLVEKIKLNQSLLLNQRRNESDHNSSKTIRFFYIGSFFIILLISLLFLFITRSFSTQKKVEESLMQSNMQLEKVSRENTEQNLLLKGTSSLERSMRGELSVEELSDTILSGICEFSSARIGSVYIFDKETNLLVLKGKYGYAKALKPAIEVGEGLIGQAAIDKKRVLIEELNEELRSVEGGFSIINSKHVLMQPIIYHEKLIAVIELGFVNKPTALDLLFIERVGDGVGIAIHAVQSRQKIEELYAEAQRQASELENQHEELRMTNEELLEKTVALQSSEEELRVQQEELSQANSELLDKARLLEEKNNAIELAREAISIKMAELEQADKYKSEFLANMSHELRTPLNSILILAKILSENKKTHLDEEEVKYAKVIHTAGGDLLALINDILDLAKVEAGQVELDVREVAIKEVKQRMEMFFSQTAKSKGISFNILTEPAVPAAIVTDERRLEQVLKNLLSNAFKFTPDRGSVTVKIDTYNEGEDWKVRFAIQDTGIGIPEDKHQTIFEAFKQADGSTSRIYGGTGLGLSISRELAQLLGGEITLESRPGEGSTFSLVLPSIISFTQDLHPVPTQQQLDIAPAEGNSSADTSKTVLIIEDDRNFAMIVEKICIERGLIPTIAESGDAGLEMARQTKPDAVLLDIMLPVVDGWSVLKQLKTDPQTHHIPVHLMSAKEENSSKAITEGALGFLKKPIEKEQLENALDSLFGLKVMHLKKVLLIEDHQVQSDVLTSQLSGIGIEVIQAFTGKEAIDHLTNQSDFDCIILDINLPDISGLDLLDQIKSNGRNEEIPVVINTAMELDRNTLERVNRYTNSMVFKTQHSNTRLVEEVNLFIDKLKTSPVKEKKKETSESLLEAITEEKTILLVDDDIRNVFSLTSALQGANFKFEIAYNGKEALEKLDANPDVDLVLMDIMMPVMNGYEAIEAIRKDSRFLDLPVIAITAKAMKDDRDKCLAVGADEYISKPVDVDALVELMTRLLSLTAV
ncbi:response regulator [Desertivirga brevis]|uniref:response regulator n=1 Tax=Desertivirga brevis TaxID=2810310 RepID=UPI001A9741C8|nr:response regulator [Pedobacter sp. SYSU D00873]